MTESYITIDIEEILCKISPELIPVDKCITNENQARQVNTRVDQDSELVGQIRRVGGLIHPIIVKKLDDGSYEIIVGQRRTGAYRILSQENSKFNSIRAYVIERDLTDDEKRVISFIENHGRDDIAPIDYVNVIEYFYTKYNRNKTMTADALGIKPNKVTQYLTYARLSDRVKQHIDNGDFSINTAMQALKALGDDEDSVDDSQLIETAKELKKLKIAMRKKVVDRMKGGASLNNAMKITVDMTEIKFEIEDKELESLGDYRDKHGYDSNDEAASEAMSAELVRDQKQ